jgi:hypothetical protein
MWIVVELNAPICARLSLKAGMTWQEQVMPLSVRPIDRSAKGTID